MQMMCVFIMAQTKQLFTTYVIECVCVCVCVCVPLCLSLFQLSSLFPFWKIQILKSVPKHKLRHATGRTAKDRHDEL